MVIPSIDLNDRSTHLGLFYAERLWNYIHINIFCVVFFWRFFLAYSPMENKWFLNRSTWPIDGNLTVTSTPGKSNGNERLLHTPQITKTGVLPSDAVWYHTQDTSVFGGGVSYLLQQGIQSTYSKAHHNRATSLDTCQLSAFW